MSHFSAVISPSVPVPSTTYHSQSSMVGPADPAAGPGTAAVGTWSQALTPPSTSAEFVQSQTGAFHLDNSAATFDSAHQYRATSHSPRRPSRDVLSHDFATSAHTVRNDCATSPCDFLPGLRATSKGQGEHLSTSSLQSECSTDSVFSESMLTPPCPMPTLLSHASSTVTTALHQAVPEHSVAVAAKLHYSQSSIDGMPPHSHPQSFAAGAGQSDGHAVYHHAPVSAEDEFHRQTGAMNSFVATGQQQHHQQQQQQQQQQQVCHASPSPTTTQAYFTNGLASPGLHTPPAFPGHPPPVSPTSLQFVPYSMDRIHQFDGNISPLQQNRQRTQPLREWLFEHRHHPYPGKADRDILAMQTHLTPDQVAMWFANTRRRIKKIGMKVWSNGRFSDGDFHAKSLPPTSGNRSSR